MNERWKGSGRTVSKLVYHIAWTPKYRRPVLVEGVDVRLKELLLEKATEHGWVIEELEVLADRCQFLITAGPTDAPHFIVNQLKGHTSSTLRAEFAWLKARLPSLWTRSYYVESVGEILPDALAQYVENQKQGAATNRDAPTTPNEGVEP